MVRKREEELMQEREKAASESEREGQEEELRKKGKGMRRPPHWVVHWEWARRSGACTRKKQHHRHGGDMVEVEVEVEDE